jgi:hypothetical protein
MRAIGVRLLIGLLAIALVAGCGSDLADSPAPESVVPSASVAPPASITPATLGPLGSECAAIPTYSPDNPQPSVAQARDPVLEQKFPTELDGQPVTGLESAPWFDAICLFGGQSAVDQMRSVLPIADLVLHMTAAAADATVDGSAVKINAFRTPGGDANQLLQNLGALAASLGNGSSTKFTGGTQPAQAGGKSVQTWTDSTGQTSYLYVIGDTLFVVDGITQSQADKIFAALP